MNDTREWLRPGNSIPSLCKEAVIDCCLKAYESGRPYQHPEAIMNRLTSIVVKSGNQEGKKPSEAGEAIDRKLAKPGSIGYVGFAGYDGKILQGKFVAKWQITEEKQLIIVFLGRYAKFTKHTKLPYEIQLEKLYEVEEKSWINSIK